MGRRFYCQPKPGAHWTAKRPGEEASLGVVRRVFAEWFERVRFGRYRFDLIERMRDLERRNKELEGLLRKSDELQADGASRLRGQQHVIDALETELGEMRRLSHTDPLTGLLNRRGATEHLAGMASALWHAEKHSGEPAIVQKSLACSIVYVDLDNFKRINDAFGHGAGDTILRNVAGLLKKTFSRKADLVARIGGDEFVVIMTHADMDGAAKQAEHFLAGLASEQRFHVMNDLYVGASIGVASMTLHPEVGGLSSDAVTASLDATIKCADRAMYTAKQSGKGRVSIHRCQ